MSILTIRVIASAWDKVQRQNSARSDLRNDSYLRDVFARYGVL